MRVDNVYEGILDKTYKELVDDESITTQSDPVRRIIIFPNSETLPTIFDDSDVIAFFDMVDDTALPLLLIERVDKEGADAEALKECIRSINNTDGFGYTVEAHVKADSKYIDIVALREDLWVTLTADDGVVTDDELEDVMQGKV